MPEFHSPVAEGPAARILIVDDHPLVRQGIRMTLETDAGLAVCGEAETADEALRAIDRTRPDLVLVDLNLRDSSGMTLLQGIRSEWPHIRTLVLSMRDEPFYVERALRAGAHGFLSKQQAPSRLVEAIQTVLRGDVYLSQAMSAKFLPRLVAGTPRGTPPTETLTDRELAVLELIGAGLPVRQIAARLHITPSTVDSHRGSLRAKLNLCTSAELLRYAVQWSQSRRGHA